MMKTLIFSYWLTSHRVHIRGISTIKPISEREQWLIDFKASSPAVCAGISKVTLLEMIGWERTGPSLHRGQDPCVNWADYCRWWSGSLERSVIRQGTAEDWCYQHYYTLYYIHCHIQAQAICIKIALNMIMHKRCILNIFWRWLLK